MSITVIDRLTRMDQIEMRGPHLGAMTKGGLAIRQLGEVGIEAEALSYHDPRTGDFVTELRTPWVLPIRGAR